MAGGLLYTSGCPVYFWHDYQVGEDAGGGGGGGGCEFVDGIGRSGMA